MDFTLYGWTPRLQYLADEAGGGVPARIISQDKGLYRVVSEAGELSASVSGAFRFHASVITDYPAVGDFVLLDVSGGLGVIKAVLPRASVFIRKASGTAHEEQVVAANVDTVFLCMALNNDFNLRRLERYLSVAWESGAMPVVALTKADLCEGLEARRREAESISMGADLLITSALESDGLSQIKPYLREGKTAAFLGSSGVGKSTLINRLLGEEKQETKQREYVCKYVMSVNHLKDMNTSNERRLLKYGDAFWKSYWDKNTRNGIYSGDIKVTDVPVEEVYLDPSAGNKGLQAGQYLFHVYRLHKLEFWRQYGADMKKLGYELDELMNGESTNKDIFSLVDGAYNDKTADTIQVIEMWFKQPFDGEKYSSGDIACGIYAGGKEIKYIPRYYIETGDQCKLFPFVHYWRVRDENDFYNKSELFAIKHTTDSADRELAYAIMNDAFNSNDSVVIEEDTLANGGELSNAPGSIIITNTGKSNTIKRLGGLSDGARQLDMINWLQQQSQRANRNYDTNNGRESSRKLTATEFAGIVGQANEQEEIKGADRNEGFRRLYELIDWMALEFYDDNRLIYIGAPIKELEKKPTEYEKNGLNFNRDDYAVSYEARDLITDEVITTQKYYPLVDVTVNAGDGVIKSKGTTLTVLDKLSTITVTPENYQLLSAMLDILDIPQKQEIQEQWSAKFASPVPPEVIDALSKSPELLEIVTQAVMQTPGAEAPVEAGGSSVESLPSAQEIPELQNNAMMGGVFDGQMQM